MDNKMVNSAVSVGSGGFLMWMAGLPWPTISYVVGVAVALLGLGISFFFQWRKDKRDALESKAIISAYNKGVEYGKQLDK